MIPRQHRSTNKHNAHGIIYLIVLRVVLKVLVLHFIPVHIQRLSVALLQRFHHRSTLVGSGVVVQHFEQIVTRSIHLSITHFTMESYRLFIFLAELVPASCAKGLSRCGGRRGIGSWELNH